MSRPRIQSASGFTLVEVLVALGIVAITLVAGLQASAALTRNTERLARTFQAQLCAENEQISLRLAHQLPNVGNYRKECPQGGQVFVNEVAVHSTPNPNFRRVDVRVLLEGQPQLQLTSLIGQY
jgi:general secretion pathway protein I